MADLVTGNTVPAYTLAQHRPSLGQFSAESRSGECRSAPHQRNRGAVLARLIRAASQDQSNKRKVFHNPAASSGFLPLARGF